MVAELGPLRESRSPMLADAFLAEAVEPFPGAGPLRALDALHLASCAYLADHGQMVSLASCDRRMNAAAEAMGIPLSAHAR